MRARAIAIGVVSASVCLAVSLGALGCRRETPAARASARATLLAALRATRARKARTEGMVRGTTPDGRTFESIVQTEVVPPDRHRSRMRLPGGVSREVVVIGARAWGRPDDRAAWQPVAAAARSVAPRIEARLVRGIEGGLLRVERTGEATLGGRATTEYALEGALPGESAGTTEARVWVRADGLVHRCEAETQSAATIRLEETWDYDDSLSIEAPAP